jgi:hypothetical protein
MGFFDWLSATAVSFTVAGNTGVAPFLSLFLVGLIERVNPDILNMGGPIETLISSWPSLVILLILTILEFVSMCVPVVDQIVDSVMAFVIPLMSTIGSLSTFGLFDSAQEAAEGSDESHRLLSAASGALLFFQIIIVLTGIVLALALHALKMLIRILGEGWLTNCLTVLETVWIVTTITMAIFFRPIAIFIAFCICCAGLYSFKRNYLDKRGEPQRSLGEQIVDGGYVKVEEPDTRVIALSVEATRK